MTDTEILAIAVNALELIEAEAWHVAHTGQFCAKCAAISTLDEISRSRSAPPLTGTPNE